MCADSAHETGRSAASTISLRCFENLLSELDGAEMARNGGRDRETSEPGDMPCSCQYVRDSLDRQQVSEWWICRVLGQPRSGMVHLASC